MELLNKDSILREIPLFANLSKAEQSLIKERISLLEYKKGQIIYKEETPASNFYCIILGRVIIYNQDRYGNERVLEYLHRGKYFGIISLLTAEPHSVSAKAINDCLILVIPKEHFDFILERIPALAIDLSRTLSRRLKRKDIHPKTIFESTIISVFSSYSQAGKTIYSLNLALSLCKETHKSVLLLDIVLEDKLHSLAQRLEVRAEYKIFDLSRPLGDIKNFIIKSKFNTDLICLSYRSEDDATVNRVIDILTVLVNDYHYLILDLPSYMDTSIFRILNQSDLIHLLTSPEVVDLRRTQNLMERLKTEFNFATDKIKVIINEYKFSKFTYEQQIGFLKHNIFATLPKIEFAVSDRLVLDTPDGEYAKVVRRISRQVGDCIVGLALGVGMAYGFCHIGVLKVIEEEKIPVDIITGSSIGAVIASLWAVGKSSQEILDIAKEFKAPKFVLSMLDFTFPWLGFIKGNRLYNFLKKYLGNKTFYDVKLPLKIVASDLRRKELKVLDKGLLVDAIMASCSMPGVFRPFRSKEEILLDGGVVNPLPTEVLFKLGVKKIIAVNVTPLREDIFNQYAKVKEDFSYIESMDIRPKEKPFIPTGKRGIIFSLRQHFRDKFKTNILDIIFSSIELMQSEMAQKEEQLADIVLHPNLEGLNWLELHRAEEFAKRGEEETRRNLDKIWQIINEGSFAR